MIIDSQLHTPNSTFHTPNLKLHTLPMAATNRTDKVKLLVKTLQKRYKHIPKPAERSLLECLMFAACLENATFDAAESAYSVLEHHYIDWNELRVSTPQEIADTLPMLPKPLDAGERIKKTLQWVFETTYMFDLEDYRKKTIGQMVEYLDSIPSCSPFMANYLVQIGLGGHQIPFDEAALRILRRLDLTRVVNGREEVSGIERLVTKVKGVEFATQMHLFGVEFFDRQDDSELLTLLNAVDKSAAGRSWREPAGVVKKADTRPNPARIAPSGSGFKPEIDLDDEDAEPVDAASTEESIEFIDTGLAALGAGSKENSGNGDSKKSKKQTSDKPESKKKPSGPVAPAKENVKASPAAAPKTEAPAKSKTVDKKPAADKAVSAKSEKTSKEKTPAPAKKPETKKPSSQKNNASKKETKTPSKPPKSPPKKPDSKAPKKQAKTAPPKSAAKKLQQKKPR